jgi:hypothetical protein
MSDEGGRNKRRRGVADTDMVSGFNVEFSPVMNEIHERQQLRKFKKLLGRPSEQRIGDTMETEYVNLIYWCR